MIKKKKSVKKYPLSLVIRFLKDKLSRNTSLAEAIDYLREWKMWDEHPEPKRKTKRAK